MASTNVPAFDLFVLPTTDAKRRIIQSRSLWRYICLEPDAGVLAYYTNIALDCISKEEPGLDPQMMGILQSTKTSPDANHHLFVICAAAVSTHGFRNFILKFSQDEISQTTQALALMETSFRQLIEGLDISMNPVSDTKRIHLPSICHFADEQRQRMITGDMRGYIWTPQSARPDS